MRYNRYQINKVVFATALIVCVYVFTDIFYKMATCDYINDWSPYYSDIIFHIRTSMETTTYSLMGLIMKALYMLPYDTASFWLALIIAGLEILTVYATYLLLLEMDKAAGKETKDVDRAIYQWFSLFSIFIVSIYIPDLLPSYYFSALNMTCWQNDTYIAMRPFAILTIMFLIRIYNKFNEGVDRREVLFFGLCFFISTWMKPSFFIAFAIVLPIVALWLLFRQKDKALTFKRLVVLALSTVPSIVCIFLQNKLVYVDNTDGNSIIFDPFTIVELRVIDWHLALTLLLVFPIVVLLFECRSQFRKKTSAYFIIWLIWIVENIFGFFFAESGPRMYDFNFIWGMTFGNAMLYIGSYYIWYNKIRGCIRDEQPFIKGHEGLSGFVASAYFVFGAILLLYLVFVGLNYFMLLYTGQYSFAKL